MFKVPLRCGYAISVWMLVILGLPASSLFDQAQAQQAKYGTTIITHGYLLDINETTLARKETKLDVNKEGGWIIEMAEAIAARAGQGQIYILRDGQINPYPPGPVRRSGQFD